MNVLATSIRNMGAILIDFKLPRLWIDQTINGLDGHSEFEGASARESAQALQPYEHGINICDWAYCKLR